MIGVLINGEFLKLSSDTNIRFEKNFQISFQELYQGDYSFPFTFDAELNYKILGFLNIPDAINKVLRYDVHIYLFGVPFKKGTLIITKANRKTFSGNLTAGLKSLRTADKSLPEIDYGNPYYLGKFSDEIANKATLLSTDGDWTHAGFTFVPHKNEKFYNNNNPDWLGTLNMVNPATGSIYYNTTLTGSKYSICPWFFLHFILKKIFDEEGLTPIGTFWEHPEMQKLLVYNNQALDSFNLIGETKVSLQNTLLMYNQGYATPSIINFIKGVINTYDESNSYINSTHEYEITQVGTFTFTLSINAKFNWNYFEFFLLSQTNVKYSRVNFANAFGVSYINGDVILSFNANIADIGKKFRVGVQPLLYPGPSNVNPTAYINSGATLTVTHTNPDSINYFSSFVDPKKHMKNVTVSEFLLAIKQMGVNFDFNYTTNTVSLDFVNDILLSNDSKNWTDKVTEDYEIDLDNYNKGFSVGYDFGTTDELLENNLKKIGAVSETVNAIYELPAIEKTDLLFYVKNLNQYYISDYDSLASPQYFWKKHTDYYFTKKYADGFTEVKIGFSPLFMGMGKNIPTSPDVTLETALMPEIKEPGSSELFNVGTNDFDLRLCFYRGQNVLGGAPHDKGGNYILASTTIFGVNGNLVGTVDFTQHLDTGFFRNFTEQIYLLTANGQMIERELRLNEVDVLTLDHTPLVWIDGIRYLLKSVSLSIGKKLKISKAKMLKL